MTFSFFRLSVGGALLAAGALLSAAAQAQPVTMGNQVMVPDPQPAYNVYPLYARPVYPVAPPVYPAAVYPYPYPYMAPVVVQPAPVYVMPPFGMSIGFGGGWRGGGWRRGGWCFGARF